MKTLLIRNNGGEPNSEQLVYLNSFDVFAVFL